MGLTSLNLQYAPRQLSPGELFNQAETTARAVEHVKMTLNDWLNMSGIVSDSDGLGSDPSAARLLQNYQDWVYAAVSAIAGRVANLEYYLQLKRPGRDGDVVDIEDHILLELLEDPNPITTGKELFWQTSAEIQLTGHAYWWLEPEGRVNAPVRIWRMPVEGMMSAFDNSGQMPVAYSCIVGGAQFTLPPDQVVHFRLPGGSGNAWHGGWSPLQAAARAMDLNLFSQIYEANFYRNNARPDFIVSYPGKLPERKFLDAFMDQLRSKHQGLDRSHLPAVLGDGAKIEPLQLSSADRRFIEVSQMTRDKILACFKVPASKLGLTTDVNRANSEASDYTFNKECVAPFVSLLAAAVNKYIVGRYYQAQRGARVIFHFENPVPKDVAAEQLRIRGMIEMGLLTPNEALGELGYEPFEGGDQRLIKTGLMLFENVAMAGVGPAFPSFSADQAEEPAPKMKAISAGKRDLTKCKSLDLWKEAADDMKAGGKIGIELHAELYSRHLKAMKKPVRDFKADLAAAFRSQEKRVLAKLEETYPKALAAIDRTKSREAILKHLRKAAETDLIDPEVEVKIFQGLTKEHMTKTLQEAVDTVMMELTGKERELLSLRARKWLNKTSRQYAKYVTKVTEGKIKDAIRDALTNGDSIDTITAKIQAMYDGFSEARAEMIARTELNSARNAGAIDGMRESGVVARKQWISALDERTRRPPASEFDHWAAHNEIAGLDDPFTQTGEELDFPGDPAGDIANLANCRCTHIAVIETEDNQ